MKKPLRSRTKSLQEQFMGVEPTWKDKEYTDLELAQAYNFYNVELNPKTRQSTVVAACTKKDGALVNKLKPWKIPNKLAALIRMQKHGFKPNVELRDYIKATIKELVDEGKKIKETPKAKVIPIYAHPTINQAIGELEIEIDKFTVAYKSDFNPVKWHHDKRLLGKFSNHIAAYYQTLVNELDHAINKIDKDIVEGYRSLKPKQLKGYKVFVQEIVAACTTKVIRVTRVKKATKKVDLNKLVARVQFLKEEKDLKLKSIEPVKLVGAKEAWLYNSKTRMLQHFETNSSDGLQIKGTTLINYNDKSEMRKIRKPETLNSMMESAPKTLLSEFKELKVKPVNCNGRINKFTLILKASK